LLAVINSENYCHKTIGIGIGNTFAKVLLLVLKIVFTSIVNIPGQQ